MLRLLSDVYTIACVCLFAENIKIIRFINFVAFGHVYLLGNVGLGYLLIERTIGEISLIKLS